MFITRSKNRRIRFIETPAEGGGVAEDAKPEVENPVKPDAEKPTKGDKPEERVYTQAELDAIVGRRDKKLEDLAKTVTDLQNAKPNEEEEQAKIEAAIAKGKLDAKRETVASQYGLDVSVLPDSAEALEKFTKGLNAYVQGHVKVVPGKHVNDDRGALPSFVKGVNGHAI